MSSGLMRSSSGSIRARMFSEAEKMAPHRTPHTKKPRAGGSTSGKLRPRQRKMSR